MSEITPAAVDVEPQPGDLKVWYFPQVGTDVPAFEVAVSDLPTGAAVLEVIRAFSAFEFEHGVKPDYSDASGLARYEEAGFGDYDWFDVEDDEIEEAIAAAESSQEF